jgi:4-hydroxy-3-methylbut-2-en-1-yl diphosphate synthase IspG/GcpE
MVRITVQGMVEAKACAEIKRRLMADGYTTPLIADIHFAPKVALAVAECFDKIRINPGNFADGRGGAWRAFPSHRRKIESTLEPGLLTNPHNPRTLNHEL